MNHFVGIAWSLSVEEWFYAVWAPVVCAVNRARLIALCAALIVVEPAVRAAVHQPDFPEYFLFITRADSLAWGALAALLLEHRSALQMLRRHARPIAGIAGATIVLTILWTHDGDRSPMRMATLGYSLLDASCAAVMVSLVATAGSGSGLGGSAGPAGFVMSAS
jgi:peptidoglycan/LPS O-acetylase OafA/YrhL